MGEHDRDGAGGGHAEPHFGGAEPGWDPHGLEPDQAQPSWRATRGADPDLRRMAKVAGGLVLVLVAVAGGWSMLGRRPHEIPVIEAPSGPLRVRPENPGGMQLASGVDSTPDGAGTLAPPPEVPQPGALRAQIQAGQATQGLAAGAAPDAVVPRPDQARSDQAGPASVPGPAVSNGGAASDAGAAPAPAARAAQAPEAGAHVAAHAPAVAAAAPAPARPDATPAAHATAVQLAAMDTEQGASTEWQRLAHRMPELLGSRHPDVQRAEHDGHPVWRLRTGGFATMAQALEFCAQVRAKGAACSIAAF
ncbi:MAG: SPOR domain-containing protein [Janthinobacterium lividum]